MKKYFLLLFLLLFNNVYSQLILKEGLNLLYYEDSKHVSFLSYLSKNENLIVDYKISFNEMTDSLKDQYIRENMISDSFSLSKYFRYPKLNLPDSSSQLLNNKIIYVSSIDSLLFNSHKIFQIKKAKISLWIDFDGIEYKYRNKVRIINDSLTLNDYASWPTRRLNSKKMISNEVFYIFDFDNPIIPDDEYSIVFLENFYIVQIEISNHSHSSELNLILLNNKFVDSNVWKNVRN